MSEAVRPVERVTLKRPLNITQQQRWGQLSCRSQTTGNMHTHTFSSPSLNTHTHTHTHTHTLTEPVCLLMLSAAFCSLFLLGCKMQMRQVSRLCTVSGGTATQIQTSVWIPKHTGYSGGWETERKEGRGWEREKTKEREDWERMSGKVAKKS